MELGRHDPNGARERKRGRGLTNAPRVVDGRGVSARGRDRSPRPALPSFLDGQEAARFPFEERLPCFNDAVEFMQIQESERPWRRDSRGLDRS